MSAFEHAFRLSAPWEPKPSEVAPRAAAGGDAGGALAAEGQRVGGAGPQPSPPPTTGADADLIREVRDHFVWAKDTLGQSSMDGISAVNLACAGIEVCNAALALDADHKFKVGQARADAAALRLVLQHVLALAGNEFPVGSPENPEQRLHEIHALVTRTLALKGEAA